MKVILLKDVAKIGRRGEVTEVPDGYALNKLIPTGMAQPATPANLKKVEKLQSEVAATKEADAAAFVAAKTALAEAAISVATELNEKGHAFKAVNENDIADAAKEAGITISPNNIVIAEPIKEVGEHTVSLEQADQKATFTVTVVKK